MAILSKKRTGRSFRILLDEIGIKFILTTFGCISYQRFNKSQIRDLINIEFFGRIEPLNISTQLNGFY